MSYLIDTNACIALIKEKPTSVRLRFQKAIDAGAMLFVSCIAAFELWYEVAKSTRQVASQQRLETFLAGPIALLPFEPEDASFAGAVRASLEAAGKPIGAYDVLMAGQALRHKLTLVTANVAEFARVKGLTWQDWSKP